MKFDIGEPSSENWKGVDCSETNGVVCETTLANGRNVEANFSCNFLQSQTSASPLTTKSLEFSCPIGWVKYGNYCYGIDQSNTGYDWYSALCVNHLHFKETNNEYLKIKKCITFFLTS